MRADLKILGLVGGVLSIYSTILALLYQSGFWFNFRINPLQYASLSEVTTSIVLITTAITFLVLLAFLPGSFVFYTNLIKSSLSRLVFLSLLLITVAATGYFAYLSKGGDTGLNIKAYTLSFIPALSLALILNFLPNIRAMMPDIKYRMPILIFICFLPFFCTYAGWQISELIKQDQRYSFVPHEYLPKSLEKISENKGLKYVGKIGSHLFFLPFDNKAMIITSEETILPLVLIEYRKCYTNCGTDNHSALK